MKKLYNWLQKNMGYDGLELVAIFLGIILFLLILILVK